MSRSGLPPTIPYGGTSFGTTALAAMTAPSSTVTPETTVAPQAIPHIVTDNDMALAHRVTTDTNRLGPRLGQGPKRIGGPPVDPMVTTEKNLDIAGDRTVAANRGGCWFSPIEDLGQAIGSVADVLPVSSQQIFGVLRRADLPNSLPEVVIRANSMTRCAFQARNHPVGDPTLDVDRGTWSREGPVNLGQKVFRDEIAVRQRVDVLGSFIKRSTDSADHKVFYIASAD